MSDYILFDLDGTLTDPYEGIANSVIYALNKFGISVKDKAMLKRFIGPPLYTSFMDFYGFDNDGALKAVGYYREYFADRGIYENVVYKGTGEMLSSLKKEGLKLAVATSKPQVFAEKILAHFNLSGYFDLISGATLDNSRVEKADIIAYALTNAGIAPYRAIMVGDRKHDIYGAKSNGLKAIGVLYGYGDEDELKKAGADFLANSPADIPHILKKML